MKQYQKDASAALTRITEDDYDASGRINQTKLYSPTNTLLASSVTTYDRWGNAKYTKDFIGHEAYFSYANADSQNTFGASGFTNSFYTPLTISANIHNALVGRAELQNGPSSANIETYYKYDSAGNLLEQKQIHNVAGYPTAWLLTDYTYDSYGNRLSTTDALGRIAYSRYSSTYQSAYLTKTSILAGTQNVTTTYTYDFAKGLLLSQTDPKGFVTSYSYDLLGRTTGVSYPAVEGVRASKVYLYDDPENILTVVDENGNSVSQYFDGLGRQTSVVAYNGSSVYSSTTYAYNWANQVASKVTPTGSVYTYAYDWEGRQVKVTNPDGTTLTASYDDISRVRTVTDENGHQTSYGYDRGGRLLWVRQYTTPSSYYLTSYTYDQSGNLLSLTDPNAAVTFYQYDDLNRLVKTTYPDGTSESRSYDAVGNLVSRTTPAGAVISYSYDSANRLVKVAYPDAMTLTYSYDNNGNVLSMVTSSASTFYAYNARNWATNQTQVVGGKRYSVLYAY